MLDFSKEPLMEFAHKKRELQESGMVMRDSGADTGGCCGLGQLG